MHTTNYFDTFIEASLDTKIKKVKAMKLSRE